MYLNTVELNPNNRFAGTLRNKMEGQPIELTDITKVKFIRQTVQHPADIGLDVFQYEGCHRNGNHFKHELHTSTFTKQK